MRTYWIEWKAKPGVETMWGFRRGYNSKAARDHAAMSPEEWPEGMVPHVGYVTGEYEALVPRRDLPRMRRRMRIKVNQMMPLAVQLHNKSVERRHRRLLKARLEQP